MFPPFTMPSKKTATAATDSTAVVPLSTDFCADDADVVIRASGTLDFRVHKAILSFVSPFFKDMFTLPQPPSTTPKALPLVDVQESANTWENILRTIYPVPNPTINNLGDLQSLLLAAKKYEMQFVTDSHKKALENRLLIQRVPLHLYAIACVCGIDDQAKFVAKNADLLTVVRTAQNEGPDALTLAYYRRLVSFLVERDNELHPILEKGWTSFNSCCNCAPADYQGGDLYEHTKRQLRAPYTRMEEVYHIALEARSRYYKKVCDSGKCSVMAMEIRKFLERMFQERERVCNKFMWK